MTDLNSMTTEQVVAHYTARGQQQPSAMDAPPKSVEYQADYMRQTKEIDDDHRRSPEQKVKAKQTLLKAAMSRIGK